MTGYLDTSPEGGQTRGRLNLSKEAPALRLVRVGAIGLIGLDRAHVFSVQTLQSGLVLTAHTGALSDAGVV